MPDKPVGVHYKYKCRQCHMSYVGGFTTNRDETITRMHKIFHGKYEIGDGVMLTMLDIHRCNSNTEPCGIYGVADFIGVEEREEKQSP